MEKSNFIFKNVNGLDCFVIKKKGFRQKQGMLAVNYGSKDNSFVCGNKEYNLPQGIAHFLEHKIFEKKKENVFELFGNIGGSVNAFTNFNSTVYYFNCTENFDDGLKILSDMLNTPYFTDENTKNEKSIINQEIKMYEDDPMWGVYFNMLSLLYPNNPIKNNIAGSIESVNKTEKEDLFDCYNSFYNRKNSALICCGDIDENKVFGCAEDFFNHNKENNTEIKKYSLDKITDKFIEKNMDTKRKIFNIGFNDRDFCGKPIFSTVSAKMLLNIAAGKSSEFYEDMCEKLILDSTFSTEYNCTKGIGFYYLGGFSDEPLKVGEKFIEQIKKLRKKGISDREFETAKKSYFGKMIKELNSVDSLCVSQADLYSKGADLTVLFETVKSITKNDLLQRLENFADEDNMVVSLIKPY